MSEELRNQAKEAGLNLYQFYEVVEEGKKSQEEVKLEEPNPESIYMFCYTSGTTGDPKAAMLAHKNYLAAATAAFCDQPEIDENFRVISYLPLAHSFEQAIFTCCLMRGIQIGFYMGDPLKLLEDL